MYPSQNAGTETSTVLNIVAARSHPLPRRRAASTPSGTPMTSEMAMPARASCAVAGTRLRIRGRTSVRWW